MIGAFQPTGRLSIVDEQRTYRNVVLCAAEASQHELTRMPAVRLRARFPVVRGAPLLPDSIPANWSRQHPPSRSLAGSGKTEGNVGLLGSPVPLVCLPGGLLCDRDSVFDCPGQQTHPATSLHSDTSERGWFIPGRHGGLGGGPVPSFSRCCMIPSAFPTTREHAPQSNPMNYNLVFPVFFALIW